MTTWAGPADREPFMLADDAVRAVDRLVAAARADVDAEVGHGGSSWEAADQRLRDLLVVRAALLRRGAP